MTMKKSFVKRMTELPHTRSHTHILIYGVNTYKQEHLRELKCDSIASKTVISIKTHTASNLCVLCLEETKRKIWCDKNLNRTRIIIIRSIAVVVVSSSATDIIVLLKIIRTIHILTHTHIKTSHQITHKWWFALSLSRSLGVYGQCQRI